MIRFVIPFLLVAIFAWVMLYGLKPRLRHQTWRNVRHAVLAVSIAFGVIVAVFAIFSLIGALPNG